jgi:hypothetical protein
MSSNSVNITGYPGIAANITYLNQCTPLLCSLDYAVVRYIPNAALNAAYASIFALLLATQICIGPFCRTHSFTFAMCCGLVLEVLGYIARLRMPDHLFTTGPFLL